MSKNHEAAARPEREADPVEAPQDWAQREAALMTQIGDLSAALDAVRSGGIDAVMIPGAGGDNLYAMTSTDRPYRVLVEKMGQGAATVSERGTVLYANQMFADLTGTEDPRMRQESHQEWPSRSGLAERFGRTINGQGTGSGPMSAMAQAHTDCTDSRSLHKG